MNSYHYLAVLMLGLMPLLGEAAVSASHLFTDEVSADQGCQRAIERIKLDAIGKQCGSTLSGGQLRITGTEQDALDRLLFESTAGYVTEFELLQRQVEMVEPIEGTSLFRCSVEAELSVTCSQGKRDPAFAPLFQHQVALNRPSFEAGEMMVVELDLQHSMHLSVLQLLPYMETREKVWRLFPNSFRRDTGFDKVGVTTIPDQQRNHYQWISALPEGKRRVVEELVVIATKSPIRFPEKMSVESFHRMLSEIPLDQRRELYIPYQIIEKKEGISR